MTVKKSRKTPKAKPSGKKPEDAVKSEDFQRAKTKAEEYVRDPEKAKKLIEAAFKKAKAKRKGPLGEVWKYLTSLIRLVRAYIRRVYTEVPWETIVLATAAIIYFVSPIDFIPDFIPVVGYVDDVAIISFVVASIKTDLDNFLDWEADQETETSDDEMT